MTGSWVERGACRSLRDTVGGIGNALGVFYPEPGQLTLRFRLVCDVCRVRCECLEWSILSEDWGGWGGTDEDQRREMRAAIADGFTSLADILRERDCAHSADRIEFEHAEAAAITPAEAAVLASEALHGTVRPVAPPAGKDSPPLRREQPHLPSRRQVRRVETDKPSLVEPLFPAED